MTRAAATTCAGTLNLANLRLRLTIFLTAGIVLVLAMASSAAFAEKRTSSAFLVSKMATSAPMGAKTICRQYTWACASSGKNVALSAGQIKMIKKVNRSINRQINEITDFSQYRREEVWALPTARGGDCEDFALLKKRQLVAAGIAPQKLLIATALDQDRQSHAVLILRTARGDYVLDNLTNQIKHWNDTGYVFLRLQDADEPTKWSAVFAISSNKT